jgi:hypothetical protein
MDRDDVVRLATAANPQEAHVWQQALADEGIRSQVVGDYLDASFGDIPGLKPELWVHRADLERARAILEAHHVTHPAGEEEDEAQA